MNSESTTLTRARTRLYLVSIRPSRLAILLVEKGEHDKKNNGKFFWGNFKMYIYVSQHTHTHTHTPCLDNASGKVSGIVSACSGKVSGKVSGIVPASNDSATEREYRVVRALTRTTTFPAVL